MTDLITRIEAGTGADRELDGEVRRLVDPFSPVTPPVTSSLDAAIALTERLLPEADGWQFTIYHDGAQASRRNFRDEPPVLEWGKSKSRPRALLAATLRAHAALLAALTQEKKA